MSYHSLAPSADVSTLVARIFLEPIFIASEINIPVTTTVWLEPRNDDHHLTLRMCHPSFAYITIVVCLVMKPDGCVQLNSGFSIDTANYVMPNEVQLQEALVVCMVKMFQTELPSRLGGTEHAKALEDRWAVSKGRVLSKLQQNHDAGMGATRLSNVDPFGSRKVEHHYPGIAAPSTRLGFDRIVGLYDMGGKSPHTIYQKEGDKKLNVSYFTHETLKSHSSFSSAEKMEILQGNDAKYAKFLPFFQNIARQGTICLPTARPDLALSARWYFQNVIFRQATYANGDSCTFDLSRAASHHLYCSLRMELPQRSSSIWMQMNNKSKSFAIERGRTNETRFSSAESLDECVRAALVCLLDIDPVWPAWIKDYFTQTFVPDHPLLAGLEIPPRHQGYIALVLGAAYDKARKDAKRLEALIAKKAAAVAAKAAESDIYPDGTIFAVLKKGVQADQADLKAKDIRRLSMLMTDTAAKSKTRRRVLEPLSEGFTSKPFTARHRVNFTPLRHVDAVRLLSDYAMGWDGREQFEMAFRLSLSLFDDALNPLLSAEGTVEIVHWAGDDVKIRVTKVRSTQGQILLAFRILRPLDEGSFLDASTGVAFLTLANKELTVALPSTFDVDEPRSQGERDILLNFIATTQGTNAEDLKRKTRVAFAENYGIMEQIHQIRLLSNRIR